MLVEIIPAILAKDEKELRRKVESVDGLCDLVQIDVIDGEFVDNVSWADPVRFEKMPLPVAFEVHLMVRDPLARLDAWSLAGCERVLIHAETVEDLTAALREAKSYGMEAGISISPETSVAQIEEAVAEADVVQVMGVHPGWMAQPFEESTIDKVKELRKKFPDLIIEVDGGVSVGVARRLADAGANRLVSGSAVFNSGAPAKSLDALRADVEDLE